MGPRFPGLGDWSRHEKASEAIVRARAEGKKKELAPWEKNVIKIMLVISFIKIAGFAIWYFGYI